jgi:predicted nucleic acid-binding protein
MAVYYFDTSGVVKRYVTETGSAWVTALSNPAAGNQCWIAVLTLVEVLAALSLRVRTGTLAPGQARRAGRTFRRELQTHYRLVALKAAIVRRAMRLVSTHPLRAYDAIQLACALRLRDRRVASGLPAPVFVCADQRLNRVALAEGLQVEDPNQHP